MQQQPTLETQRLILRPFDLADASDILHLAGNYEVARTTMNIPHPYEDGMAEEWIATHEEQFKNGKAAHFAVVSREEQAFYGTVGLEIHSRHNNATLGYWIGLPYWGRGYCTEAVRAVLQYSFRELGLHRISAEHFKSNPASGRVMQKLGMQYEGCSREQMLKWGQYEDLVRYGLLASEWSAA